MAVPITNTRSGNSYISGADHLLSDLEAKKDPQSMTYQTLLVVEQLEKHIAYLRSKVGYLEDRLNEQSKAIRQLIDPDYSKGNKDEE